MRFGQVIGLKEAELDSYRQYHAEVWPSVLKQIRASNIHNYSIFYNEGYLFAYFEYTGEDFEGDMQSMASDPETQRWWQLIMPMQQPMASVEKGEWWSNMEELFHLD